MNTWWGRVDSEVMISPEGYIYKLDRFFRVPFVTMQLPKLPIEGSKEDRLIRGCITSFHYLIALGYCSQVLGYDYPLDGMTTPDTPRVIRDPKGYLEDMNYIFIGGCIPTYLEDKELTQDQINTLDKLNNKQYE